MQQKVNLSSVNLYYTLHTTTGVLKLSEREAALAFFPLRLSILGPKSLWKLKVNNYVPGSNAFDPKEKVEGKVSKRLSYFLGCS